MKTVKEKIRDREPVFGTMISEMACPNLARIFKAAGFAYMIVDCEHGYFDYSQLAAMVSVANGAGIGAVVRIPTIDRGVITKVLDMGADGLLVPMVNTADEARQIVSYAKYPPLGHRGASTQRAHTNYDPPKLEEYFEIANARTIILAQIETRQALDHVGEIAAVEGIDAVVIGGAAHCGGGRRAGGQGLGYDHLPHGCDPGLPGRRYDGFELRQRGRNAS